MCLCSKVTGARLQRRSNASVPLKPAPTTEADLLNLVSDPFNRLKVAGNNTGRSIKDELLLIRGPSEQKQATSVSRTELAITEISPLAHD